MCLPPPDRADHAAGDFHAGIACGLGVKIIWVRVDHNGFPENVRNPETVGQEPQPGSAVAGQQAKEQTPSSRRLAAVHRTDRLYLRGRKFIHTLTGCA